MSENNSFKEGKSKSSTHGDSFDNETAHLSTKSARSKKPEEKHVLKKGKSKPSTFDNDKSTRITTKSVIAKILKEKHDAKGPIF